MISTVDFFDSYNEINSYKIAFRWTLIGSKLPKDFEGVNFSINSDKVNDLQFLQSKYGGYIYCNIKQSKLKQKG